MKNSSSSFAECENICGRLLNLFDLLSCHKFESHEQVADLS